MDPRARLALVLCAGILAITLDRPATLIVYAALCAVPLILARIQLRWWRRGLLAVLAIVWSTTLSQGMFYAEQPRVSLGHIGPLHLYREGVRHGLAQSLRLVGLSLAGLGLAVTTPADRLHAALLALRMPFGLALMAATAVRFLPEVTRELATVRRARAARGRPAWKRAPWAWLVLEVSLLRPVVARSLRRAWNLAESLDARGFDPVAPRTRRRPLQMRPLDWGVVGLALSVAVTAASLRIVYILYTSETWFHPALRGVVGFVRNWM